ncbi:MAG TPA: protein kinase, partial [Gemmataceae bacterium]
AANGLEHARQSGLVHRDVKPGNIMVQPGGLVKLLDLGLAVFRADPDPLTLADRDLILGTADYIAPEQAVSSHDVDTRADIYSLGATMYFMLTGRPPFPDKSVAEKLVLHQIKEPTPVRELAPSVPEEVAAILAKMMAKDRAARFATPREVREALQPFARPGRLYDPSLIRFPRAVIEQYLRFGGEAPPSSGNLPRAATPASLVDTDPDGGTVGTDVRPPSRTSAPAAPARRSRRPLWLGLLALGLLGAAVAGVLLSGLLRPTGIPGPRDGETPLGERVLLGPGGLSLPLSEVLGRMPPGGVITLADRPGGWEVPTLEVAGEQLPSGGRVTLAGAGPGVVLRPAGAGPIVRVTGADGFTLRDLTLDGGGGPGPLVEVEGNAPGVTLERLTVRNLTGDAVRLVGARGGPERPVYVHSCTFEVGPGVPLAFRSRTLGDRGRHVRVLGCEFGGNQAGILVAQPVDGLAVRECTFSGGNYGIKFTAALTLDEDAAVRPVRGWKLAGWWAAGDEPEFDPSGPPGEQVGGKPWEEIEAGPDGHVQLGKHYGFVENVTALAYARFDSDRAGLRRLFVGADDEVTIWVNGRKVFEHFARQGYLPGEFSGVAEFREGENHVWVRVLNGIQNWGFGVQIARGYVPLTPAEWKNVTVAANSVTACSKAVMFAHTPSAASRVEIAGNDFRRVRHHPILVLRSGEPVREGTIVSSRNADIDPPGHERAEFRDATAFELIPLDE